jgi:hypothetical protein
MNKKYFITARCSGLGDLLCNLACTYYFAKKYNGNVIIDWRKIYYNYNELAISDEYKKSNVSNLFNAIFIQPDEINGVNFILADSDEIYWNNKINIPHICPRWHKISDFENQKEKEKIENILDSHQYILISQRIHEYNQIYPHLQNGSFPIISNEGNLLENFCFLDFLSKFNIQPNVRKKIDYYIENFFKNSNVVGLHIRYGNPNKKDLSFRKYPENGKYWIDEDELLSYINNKIKRFNNNFKFLIACDNQKINKLLLDNIPNSFSIEKKYPDNNNDILLCDRELDQISKIQDAFIDMYLLKMCNFLFYTAHSVYTVYPLLHHTNMYTNFEKVEIMFEDRFDKF